MIKPREHVKWKKLVTEAHLLHIMNCSMLWIAQNRWISRSKVNCLGLGVDIGGDEELLLSATEVRSRQTTHNSVCNGFTTM